MEATLNNFKKRGLFQFANIFKKVEVEIAAVLVGWVCLSKGDWGPVRFPTDLYACHDADPEFRKWFNNPFVNLSYGLLTLEDMGLITASEDRRQFEVSERLKLMIHLTFIWPDAWMSQVYGRPDSPPATAPTP